MKKTFANIRTLAAVLMTSAALVACNKEYNATAEQTPQVYTLTIDASMDGGAQTRALEFEGTKLVAKWANDETVDVRFGPTLLGTLTVSNVSADGKSCTLSGTLTGTIDKGYVLRFHYNYTSPVNESQTGTLSSTAGSDYAMAAVTVKSVAGGNITLESEPNFQTQVAVLKITMQDALANKLNATSLKIKIGDKDLCTLSPNATAYSENGDGVVYFALPSAHRVYTEGISSIVLDEEELAAATVTFTATVGGNTYIATKTGYPFAAGKYYATTLTMANLLSGVFSVSSTKKVSFSKGNLQATYNGSSWTWAFAANQWDYIGNAEGNTKVSDSTPFVSGYSGSSTTVDLFGWVGASSTWTGVNKYGITSSSATNNKNGYGNVASESLKSDWGALIGLGWRTLSMAEWTYLLATRTVNGGKGADKSYTINQSVNGKRGMVIYPDNYTGAVYSGDNWASFEAAGCVFLPAAGWREGTTIRHSINDRGYYWSTTPSNATAAKRMFFAGSLELDGDNSRAFGFSVRLVREVE